MELKRLDAVTVAQLDAFDEVIDVRSPAEFALDHVPSAVNCPVLDDSERAHVGMLYKQISPFDAKKIGDSPATAARCSASFRASRSPRRRCSTVWCGAR